MCDLRVCKACGLELSIKKFSSIHHYKCRKCSTSPEKKLEHERKYYHKTKEAKKEVLKERRDRVQNKIREELTDGYIAAKLREQGAPVDEETVLLKKIAIMARRTSRK